MKNTIIVFAAVAAFGSAPMAFATPTYSEVLNSSVQMEGNDVTPATSWGQLLTYMDKYNNDVPAKHPSYLNIPEVGSVVSTDKCDLVITQEDMVAWFKMELVYPDLDPTKFFGDNRCNEAGGSTTSPQAMSAMLADMSKPMTLRGSDGKVEVIPPAITPEDAKGKTEIMIAGKVIDSIDFSKECVEYTGKFWEWRISKCSSLNPDWKSPGIGKTLSLDK